MRELSNNDIDNLLFCFWGYNNARKRYLTEFQYSSEISIPARALKASYEQWRLCWLKLCMLLNKMRLRTVPYHGLVWPKRIRGEKKRIEALQKWMEKDGHRKDMENPY
jgi:hypothetical protein